MSDNLHETIYQALDHLRDKIDAQDAVKARNNLIRLFEGWAARVRNQALEDAAKVFDESAEDSRQIAKRRHDVRAFEAAREFYQQAERSARSAEIIREMKSAI